MILERIDHIVKACVLYKGDKLVRQYDSRSGKVRWMKVVKDWNFYLYTIDGEEEVERLERAYHEMYNSPLTM